MSGEKREFYAEAVQAAVEKAASFLGVAADELEYTVLDEGSSGFLGIGARDARISVSVPDTDSELTTDSPSPALSDVDETSAPEEVVEQEHQEAGTYPSEDPAPPVEEREVSPEEGAQESPAEEASPELIVAVDGFATELLQKMGFDATVDAYDAGEVIQVDIGTKETGLLIGQKGETIDSIQYLINLAVYKDRPFAKRITVDTEGYRQRRVEALQGMAHRTARRAQREKRPIDLPPMTSSERRVVHLYLKDNPTVSTSSEGEEDKRRVVVAPND